MELEKIGDQNVVFFKGHLILFGATKSAQPFRSNHHLKLEKKTKKSKHDKLHCLPPSFVFKALFSFFFLHRTGRTE